MGEASMHDCIFLILLFYMYICILYVDILSNKSIYLSPCMLKRYLVFLLPKTFNLIGFKTYHKMIHPLILFNL
jgi:hypothetical protein